MNNPIKPYANQASEASSISYHPVKRIFGCETPYSGIPVVVDAFTGSGKTTSVVLWLAEMLFNKQALDGQYIVAFNEVRLACEMAVLFNSTVKATHGTVKYNNLNRVVKHQYNVTHDHIKRLEKSLTVENRELLDVLHFMKCTGATTRMTKARMAELMKARVVFTTHESLLTLAKCGVTKGKHIIVDEAPANYYSIVETDNPERQQEIYSMLAESKDANADKMARIGSYANDSIMLHSQTYRSVVQDGSSKPFEHIYSTLGQPFGAFEASNKEKIDVGELRVCQPESGVSYCYYGDSKKGTLKSEGQTFYVDYVNLMSFKAATLTLMSATPLGTSIAILEKLSGVSFTYVEPDVSVKKREAAAARVMRVKYGNCSCSKDSLTKREGETYLRGLVAMVLKTCAADSVLGVAHSWCQDILKEHSINCVKLNSTGTNLYRGKTCAIIANLSFFSPKQATQWRAVFGTSYDSFEKNYLAASLNQSIMRTSLRTSCQEPVVVAYFDGRVDELMNIAFKI